MANYQAPNLADILRTLSALAPQPQGQQSEGQTQASYHEPAPHPQQWPPVHQPAHQPEPARQLIPTQQWDPTPQWEAAQQYSQVPQLKPPAQQLPQQPPKLQDPATIIDWSTGLRCVMKSVSTNERIVGEIRKLIQTQHEHETQWYAGRQALLMKIEARKIGQKRLDDVLRAVGGQVPETETAPLPTTEELRTFDMKVYRAQHQMVKEMSVKLKTLGIPFFGTRSDLIDRDPGAVRDGTSSDGRISERELVELQRKVLAIIEDLCW